MDCNKHFFQNYNLQTVRNGFFFSFCIKDFSKSQSFRMEFNPLKKREFYSFKKKTLPI